MFIVEKVSQAVGFPLEMFCCVKHSRHQLEWLSWDLGWQGRSRQRNAGQKVYE